MCVLQDGAIYFPLFWTPDPWYVALCPTNRPADDKRDSSTWSMIWAVSPLFLSCNLESTNNPTRVQFPSGESGRELSKTKHQRRINRNSKTKEIVTILSSMTRESRRQCYQQHEHAVQSQLTGVWQFDLIILILLPSLTLFHLMMRPTLLLPLFISCESGRDAQQKKTTTEDQHKL